MSNIYKNIQDLLEYGKAQNLIGKYDEILSRNMILDILGIQNWEEVECEKCILNAPTTILEKICDYAVEKNIIEDTITERDLFSAKIMGELTPKPSQVIEKFNSFKDKKSATNYYYDLSRKTNYIMTDRVAKNMHWLTDSPYGDIEITINLSKPEKDPKEIARQKDLPKSGYPSCLLCYENVGFAGNLNHPARQNHRVLPLTLTNEEWFMQYSPYVYYNEHTIVFCKNHRPMKIDKSSFTRLFDFVDFLPHYFIGSNADLPIVGGSILSHDHYQGGHHDFPMAKSNIKKEITFKGFEDISTGIVNWPMSVIRLNGKDKNKIIDLATKILTIWREYSDEEAGILDHTDAPHSTITPIARKRNGNYEIDLVLRNNRTNECHPLGIYHPHSDVHNIKKENIGLIEVMGLAVLPGRLKQEMNDIKDLIIKDDLEKIKTDETLGKHYEWAKKITSKYDGINSENIDEILKTEIGKTFIKGLEDAGVFKNEKDFLKFVEEVNRRD